MLLVSRWCSAIVSCIVCLLREHGMVASLKVGAVIADSVCTLEAFQDTYWKPFIMTEEQRLEACKVTFEHEQPAASGGDSLSGF